MAELSGFEVLALLKEIDLALHGTYVNNVYTFGASQLLRLRKPEAPDVWLVASPRYGVWISEAVSERAETSEFTTRLRGELERARYVGASQVDLDRVFELTFERGVTRKLVVELMPPGNLVVLDEKSRVVLAQREVRTPKRRVVKGEDYRPPKQGRHSPADVMPEDVAVMLAEEKTAGRAIGRHVGIPRKYVAEALRRLGVSDESPSSALRGKEEAVSSALRRMVSDARDNPRPCVCGEGGAEEIFVIPPRGAEVTATSRRLSELCDRVFLSEAGESEEARPEAPKKRELEVTVARLKAESASLMARASKVREEAKSAAASSMEGARAILGGAGVDLARAPASPSAIASALYDHAKTLERRAAESLGAAANLEKKLTRLKPAAARPTTPLRRRRREWFEGFRWFVTSGGRLAVGGRDAQSNSLLIRRHLEEEDVVYHADLFGSPFFILKGGSQQTDQDALELAQATVSFSSGWKTGLGAADAYWVIGDQVSESPESGEYLARGSFVIRGRKNFIRHAILQVALGLDEGGRVMAGPESAVARACLRYVVLVPHREKQSDTAKKVAKEISLSAKQILDLDEVIRALPAGGGKIVRRKTGVGSSG